MTTGPSSTTSPSTPPTDSTKPSAARSSSLTMTLPESRTKRSITPQSAKVLLYGHPKVGKTTLAANLDPERTLFLATEPGLGGVEVFALNIGDWNQFRQAGALLSKDKERFTTVVIDTVDNLYQFCMDQKMQDLGIQHPSELDYGKGWAAVTDEFRLRVSKLASMGCGLWFISHAKEQEVKTRVGSVTRISPTLSGKARDFVTGFADMILYAAVEQDGEGNSVRRLHTQPTELFEAGCRVELPSPLPLEASAIIEAMENAS